MGTAVKGILRPEYIASYWTLAGAVMPRAASQVSPFAFEDRVRAAAGAAYSGFGLMYDDLRAVSARLGLRQMKHILDDHGLIHVELEFLGDWFAEDESRVASDRVRHDLLLGAQALAARHIKVGGDSRGMDWPRDRLVEEFAALCKEAAKFGTGIALELLPWTKIASIQDGLDIVVGAGAPNGGLLLDIWHLVRGNSNFADIATIPPQYIKAAELSDADARCVGSLWEDTIHRRKLCGDGAFDIRGFLASLRAAGFYGPFGVEIISDEHRTRSLDEAARLSLGSARRQFSQELLGSL